MFTKESIFPLYVGKCRVKAKSNDFIKGEAVGDFNSYFLQTKELEFTNQGCDYIVPISDCTLLLKPLSKMSGEKVGKLRAFMGLSVVNCTIDDLYEFLTEGKRIVLNLIQINKLYSWLISHGYAISDELFELNIAEEIKWQNT